MNVIAGFDEKQVCSRPSRTEGPRFKWVQLNGRPALDQCRSTPVSRAWRRVAAWLRDIHSAKPGRSTDNSRHKLLHYQHDLQVADPSLQQEKISFLAWNGLLTKDMLQNEVVVKSLLEVATSMAEASDNEAALRSTRSFQAWLHEGAGGGLRNQHRLTRCATGWFSSKVAVETQAELSLMDDVEGLTEELLQHINE